MSCHHDDLAAQEAQRVVVFTSFQSRGRSRRPLPRRLCRCWRRKRRRNPRLRHRRLQLRSLPSLGRLGGRLPSSKSALCRAQKTSSARMTTTQSSPEKVLYCCDFSRFPTSMTREHRKLRLERAQKSGFYLGRTGGERGRGRSCGAGADSAAAGPGPLGCVQSTSEHVEAKDAWKNV